MTEYLFKLDKGAADSAYFNTVIWRNDLFTLFRPVNRHSQHCLSSQESAVHR